MTRNKALEVLNNLYGEDKIAMCRDCNVLLPYDADAGVQCPSCVNDMDVFDTADQLLDMLEDQGCEITHMVTGDEVERMVVVNVERYASSAERRQLLAACGW